jgi:DNA polymerase-3 subunit beta
VLGQDLIDAADLVKAAIGRGSSRSLPVLACVHVELGEPGLTLRCTDLEQEMRVTVPAAGAEWGAVVVNAERFAAVAKAAGAGVQLTATVSTLMVNGAGGRFSLPTMAADDYPQASPELGDPLCTLDNEVLLTAIQQVAYAMSQDESRGPQLAAVRGRFTGGRLELAATDGHRLTVTTVPVEGEAPEGREVLIGRDVVRSMQALLKRKGPVRWFHKDSFVRIELGGATLTARTVEGAFPNVVGVIAGPQQQPVRLSIDVEAFKEALGRVTAIGGSSTMPVAIQATPDGGSGRVTLLAQDPDAGEAEVELLATHDAAPFKIGLNSKYLSQYLSACEVGTVALRMATTEGLTPVLFEGDGLPLAVIMPMRL